jgi:hypothetical protein
MEKAQKQGSSLDGRSEGRFCVGRRNQAVVPQYLQQLDGLNRPTHMRR